ncbi:hypothetical protein DCMF_10750 [Candidatus Formimonas warabiya]|uniref:DUF4130 domain-containing protein n=2 Tax=Formimonas warabiya TaxID=1761012 RepID=A0A3G1KSP4_FORW1|nr:hypothetical protein DCMF_10750 [Candidatus Formimonas warabiya]
MVIFIFDGTFEGMLTAIYQAYYFKKPDRILFRPDLQERLFEEKYFFRTDAAKSDQVYAAIEKKISRRALEHIMYAFLSEDANTGTWVLNYLDFGWQAGKKLDMFLDDDRVKKIHDLSYRVAGERHRLLGLIRFRQLSLNTPVYYAPYEPDNNVTMLLAPHFARRLPDQNWIIHDVKRNLAAVHHPHEWVITDLTRQQIPPLADQEAAYQDLWRQYYRSIAIGERRNPALQKQLMPMKYWKYLVEKEETLQHTTT